MLGTFSMFFTRFELELTSTKNMDDVEPDMNYYIYPTGTLPPNKVPFRIRKRTAK